MAVFIVAPLAVVLLNLYALILIVARSRVYGRRLYRPMLVNIGLSLAPVVVAVALVIVLLVVGAISAYTTLPGLSVVVWISTLVAGLVWVLFFPNSQYLITELNMSHREADDPVPLWFDIAQTLTLALSGIANAIVGLAMVQLLAALVFGDANAARGAAPASSWVLAIVVLTLGAVGVYVGRYLRFNSWDIRHPVSMWRKARAYFSVRGRWIDFFGFVGTQTILLVLLYVPLFAITYQAIAG